MTKVSALDGSRDALTGLTNLTYLDLGSTNTNDLTLLAGLTSLTQLLKGSHHEYRQHVEEGKWLPAGAVDFLLSFGTALLTMLSLKFEGFQDCLWSMLCCVVFVQMLQKF